MAQTTVESHRPFYISSIAIVQEGMASLASCLNWKWRLFMPHRIIASSRLVLVLRTTGAVVRKDAGHRRKDTDVAETAR